MAVIEDVGGQLLRGASLCPRLPIGVQIDKQKSDPGQIHHPTIAVEKFGLRDPGIPSWVDHFQYGRHIGEAIG
ncbi:hypothetical protein D3C78_1524210 [compost metagenome]